MGKHPVKSEVIIENIVDAYVAKHVRENRELFVCVECGQVKVIRDWYPVPGKSEYLINKYSRRTLGYCDLHQPQRD
jgi:hypothetical protein